MITISRRFPINIIEQDENLFRHEIIKQIETNQIFYLNNIISDGTLNIYYQKKISEKIFEKLEKKSFNIRHFFKKLILLKFRIYKSTAIIITDGWSSGYFHWMLDCLPRMMLVYKSSKTEKIILPGSLKQFSFVHESLQILKIKNYTFLKEEYLYFLKKVLFPAHLAPTGNYNPEVLQKLRTNFLSGVEIKKVFPEKIYISRALSSKRKITNEDEIIKLLGEFGYVAVYCEQLSLREQASLFASVKCVIANHGAGLTNILFMPAGANVLELRAEDDVQNNCYFSLASAMELNYYYLKSSIDKKNKDLHNADVTVDAASLTKLLIQFNL
ncbi:hypothetical protein BH09BAC2_BH09BAC2_15900 [soil metagenome]